MTLKLYSIFHLNLAFSSIEEEQRPEVIRRCYWPLLRLARELNLSFGIEITGYTLETVAAIDPGWVAELRDLCTGHCELIGSGYAQLISPLVPAEVNRQNLLLGNKVYETLLGQRPFIALINEQAYSAGLIRHYLDAGYRAIVMEWDNPAFNHPEWNPEWRYFPQIAVGQHGEEIPVIWNNSISFQKFQRYVHGELELDEYLKLIARHCAGSNRAFPLYGNDVEIFDFRPGRFSTEAAMAHNEWGRIRILMESLMAEDRFTFVAPSVLLHLLNEPGGGNRISLESPESPIPVKKQEKYNITRWAVTGRDDLTINTSCQRIHDALVARGNASDDDWRELCYLWSSDFRTHITSRRWQSYRRRLNAFVSKSGASSATVDTYPELTSSLPPEVKVTRDERYLSIGISKVKVVLNLLRGLAVDSLIFFDVCNDSLCGTLPHGYYDDISSGADFYTGHVVFETPGRPKVTDLVPVTTDIGWNAATEEVIVAAIVETPFGKILKRVTIGIRQGVITLHYKFFWKMVPVGSLRIGNVTLNPEAFCQDQLYYRTHNGGAEMEAFDVAGKRISHGEPTSFLVSAKQGIGATEGVVEIGDSRKVLRIEVDLSLSTPLGMIISKPVGASYFFRCCFSALEMDETSKKRYLSEGLSCKLTISGLTEATRDIYPMRTPAC
ncbi:MAG: glycoside hydrolase family 57 [Deltaproteobacteria bacterium]|nr:glycoside hydrolase family 57 [Deltaproteobacteria bacterium]